MGRLHGVHQRLVAVLGVELSVLGLELLAGLVVHLPVLLGPESSGFAHSPKVRNSARFRLNQYLVAQSFKRDLVKLPENRPIRFWNIARHTQIKDA